jgi:RND superfamily putative drug exporter
MRTLARWCCRHWIITIVGWVAVVVVLVGLHSAAGSAYTDKFTLPHTQSSEALKLLQRADPKKSGETDQLTISVDHGKVTDPAVKARAEKLFAQVAKVPNVAEVISPYTAQTAKQIAPDGTVAFADVVFDNAANNNKITASQATHFDNVITSASSGSVQFNVEGNIAEAGNKQNSSSSLFIGFIAAAIVLFLAFGSIVAMFLPLITAGVSLGAGTAVIGLLSHALDIASFSSELALLIGLGVGVDYALFIVTRFRENYQTNGGNAEQAVEAAINTSGRAVLFAGVTVVIALLGMFALGVSLLSGAAVAASIGVVLVLAASLTLLPALLSLVGRRVGEAGGPRAEAQPTRPGFWMRWVQRVQRRPALTAVAATTVMLVLAAPALGLRLASSDAGNDPTSQTTRQAFDLLAEGFGPGFNGPLQLAVALPRPHDTGALNDLSQAVKSTPGVVSVAPPELNQAGTAAAVVAYPSTSPQSAQTSSLVTRLRDSVIPAVEQRTGARVYVGGATAAQVDFSHVLASKLPLFIGVVVALAALLLLVVFRSFVIPVQAALMNLLSIGASLGIVQAVFERGWLGGLFGAQPGPIDSFIPVLTFAIVFGLSMDYEVFLISRVHEEWQARRDASAAIREGLARTGRVITAAAAVMVSVFAAFAISGDRVLAMFGLAMASAVFLDALVVRMLLLPAVLELLGRTTWAMPRWLDRRLPRIAIEAEDQDAAQSAPPRSLEPAIEAAP